MENLYIHLVEDQSKVKKAEILEYLINEFTSLGHIEIELKNQTIRAPRFLGTYPLLSTQLDFIETGKISLEDVRTWVANDHSIFALSNSPAENSPEFVSKAFDVLKQWGIDKIKFLWLEEV